jgi:hypothetical protein
MSNVMIEYLPLIGSHAWRKKNDWLPRRGLNGRPVVNDIKTSLGFMTGAPARPRMFTPQPNRPLRQTLLLGIVVIGVTMLGAVILYAVTEWLWLVVHQGLR